MMYIDCTAIGCSYPSATKIAFTASLSANSLKGARNSCSAWPILLIACALSTLRSPASSSTPSSKKQLTLLADCRNQSSDV